MSFTYTETTIPSRQGDALVGHVWLPTGQSKKATVVIFHGYAAHGRYGTVVFAAEMLAAHGFTVVSADLHGFGKSPGAPGFIDSVDSIVGDCADVAMWAKREYPEHARFALGSSMGGNFALRVTLGDASMFRGAVLLGPMVQVAKPPPAWQLPVLKLLASVPGLRSIGVLKPSGLASDKQYKDPERRAVCDDDELGFHGDMCLATGKSLLDASLGLEARLKDVTVPMLVIHGDADEIVPLAGSEKLDEESASDDKTLTIYPGMLHSPLCEYPETRDKVEAQILAWLEARL